MSHEGLEFVDEVMSPLRQREQPLRFTVLVVEDHFITRWSAAEYLRRVGFKVVEAVNVEEARGVINCGTPVDLVFSDVRLPGNDDGYGLAAWLAEQRPEMPVVLTSSAARDPAAPADGALRRFVPKPYDLSRLAQLLRSLLPSTP
jgi:DNA-binding NtrC family response regulator